MAKARLEQLLSKESTWFLVALGIRLPFLWMLWAQPSLAFCGDSEPYLILGQHVWTYCRFPAIHRPPLYPALLSPLVGLFGPDPRPIALFQILLDASSTALLLRVSRTLHLNSRGAIATAALYACAPLAVLYSVKVMSESLFSILLILTVLSWSRVSRSSGAGPVLLTGLLGGALMLCRSIGLGILPLLALGHVFRHRGTLDRTSWRQAAWLLVAGFGLVLPYMVYNHARSGLFGITNVWHGNTAFYTLPAVRQLAKEGGLWEFTTDYAAFITRARRTQWEEQRAERGWIADWDFQNDHSRVSEEARRAAPEILRHPILLASLHLAGALRQLVPQDSIQLYGEFFGVGLTGNFLLLAVAAPLHGGLFVLGAIGLCRGWCNPTLRIPFSMFALTIGYMILTPGAGAESDRFSVPCIPLLCVLAGYLLGGPTLPKGTEPAPTTSPP